MTSLKPSTIRIPSGPAATDYEQNDVASRLAT